MISKRTTYVPDTEYLTVDYCSVEKAKDRYQQRILSEMQVSKGFDWLISPYKHRISAKEVVSTILTYFKMFEYEEDDVALFQVNIVDVAARYAKEKNADPGVKILISLETKTMPNKPIRNSLPTRTESFLYSSYIVNDPLEMVESVSDAIAEAVHRNGAALISDYTAKLAKEQDTKAKKDEKKSGKGE